MPSSETTQHATQPFDVIVIGGGAAGLMCAIEAGERGRRVLVLDRANRMGKKILISGGGRCNFTNQWAVPEDYQSQNPRFCVSALSRYTPWDFIALVEQRHIPYHEKKLGQLFCDHASQDILDMLLAQCAAARVALRTGVDITQVRREDDFYLETNQGVLRTESLVVATGGKSIPQMGASGFAHDLARQFGLPITETRPALVPFTCDGAALELSQQLSGVSIACVATCNGVSFEENLLFTHRGVSGPAILQISSHWREGDDIRLDLLPGLDLLTHLQGQQILRPRTELATVLSELLPRRFVRAIGEASNPHHSLPQSLPRPGHWPIGQCSPQDLVEISGLLQSWPLIPQGTEGYRTAEVTLGGVDTTALSSKTMATLTIPNLYFIGEAVDVTGPLGGYNFQWAWASGYCAGQYA